MAREKEEAGPGIGGVFLAGFITLLIGMILGVFSLVTQKVEVLNKVPDPESLEAGSLVYVKGTRSGRTSWRAKEQAWKSGQLSTLILTEAELNQWSESSLNKKNAKPEEAEEGWLSMFAVAVSPANFRIIDDKLQIAAEVEFPGILPSTKYIYQVTGRFESVPDGVEFVSEFGALGQAPIGVVPFSSDMMFSFLGKQYGKIEEAGWLQDSFGDLKSAEISEGQLILRRRTDG